MKTGKFWVISWSNRERRYFIDAFPERDEAEKHLHEARGNGFEATLTATLINHDEEITT